MGFLIEVEKRKRRFFLYFRVSFFVDEMKLSFALLASLSMAGRIKEKSKLEELEEKYKEDPLVKDIDRENDPQDYDHAAFAGEDEYKTFDDLSPEEAKEKLGLLIDKMDKDGDGKVTWDEYKKHTYGFLSDDELSKEEEDGFSYQQMLIRDERRFRQADQTKKGYLDKEDLTAFLHPEEYDHMKDMVIQETIEDIDKDGDGKISLTEYIGDMWLEDEDEGEEPDWVEEERKQFHDFRDKDQSGFLENEEVRDWILPSEYDHAEGEARHLIESADSDNDGILTKHEILENHDVFVGSQATDWGDAIVRHDEF